MKDYEEEEKGYRAIASVLERHGLEEGTAIFTYINTVVGYYDRYSCVFTDDQGREYYSTDTGDVFYSPSPYVCGSVMSVDEAYNKYSIKKDNNIQQVLDAYDEDNAKYIALGSLDEEDRLVLIKVDYNESLDKYREQLFGDKKVNQKEEIKTTTANEEVGESEDDFKDLEKKLRKNDYTKEELKSIKRELTNKKKTLRKMIDITQKKLKEASSEEVEFTPSFDVDKIFKSITKTLISQDEPAKRMIVEVERLRTNKTKEEAMKEEKNGILLTGSTGVGKSKLMKLLASELDIPFLTINSTQLTAPGYEGKNIEQCLWELYENCDKDIEKAENAIIFFDEIDKKGSTKKDDVSGQAVLNLLLKFLDGTTYQAAKSLQPHDMESAVDINTSRMIIIAGGAFSDVYGVKKTRALGFGSKEEIIDKGPTIEDFVEKAMMPKEFMGRFPVIIKMNDLDKNSMKKILEKSEQSPIVKQKDNFKKVGVSLSFNDEALDKMAELACELKAGARGLAGIVTNITYKPYEYALSNKGKVKNITITKDTMEDNDIFIVNGKLRDKTNKKFYLDTKKGCE